MEKKVLIVDDEEAIRSLLDNAFRKAGFSPVVAGSGEEALAILEKDNIQVMFLDMNLPGMNGMELCAIIRKNNPVACIYSMTGYGSIFQLTECRDIGFDDYFLKPINMKTFIKTAEDSFKKLARWKKK
jgi:DNA-binding response OmpR family regulator